MGATFNATFNATNVNIDENGNMNITGAVAGATLTMTFNNTTIMIDSSGNVKFELAGGAKFDLTTEGGTGSDGLALVSKLVNWLSNHTHQNSGGSGNGGVPAQSLDAGDIQSNLVGIEN